MAHTAQSLSSLHRDALVNIMKNEYVFKTTPYGNLTINYKKPTLVNLILTFQRCGVKVDNTVTECLLTKPEIAKQLFFAYKIIFTDHEIRYIPRDEFIVLFNNLIDGVPSK